MNNLYIINRLKYYRKKNHYTQSQLAKLCNTTKNTISSIERYEFYPTLTLAYKLSFILKVSIDKLFIPDCSNLKLEYSCYDCKYLKIFSYREKSIEYYCSFKHKPIPSSSNLIFSSCVGSLNLFYPYSFYKPDIEMIKQHDPSFLLPF